MARKCAPLYASLVERRSNVAGGGRLRNHDAATEWRPTRAGRAGDGSPGDGTYMWHLIATLAAYHGLWLERASVGRSRSRLEDGLAEAMWVRGTGRSSG
jgi:hypothetical protein